MKKSITINLNHPAVNPYLLIGIAEALCKLFNKNFKLIQTELLASDYNNFKTVFHQEFSSYVTLE